MKFSLTVSEKGGKGLLASLSYNPCSSEIAAACDDKTIAIYNSNDASRISDSFEVDVNVVSISYIPTSGNNKSNSDIVAASCSDGTLRYLRINKNGVSLEKKIVAHNGAVICVKWNNDGSSLATSGEDGEVKIWSKTGNLRTKLATYFRPVYALSWGGEDNDSLLVAHGHELSIIRTQSRGNVNQWQGQPKGNGVILALDWNKVNNLIICGGEDCCFRIFNTFGGILYTSSTYQHVITSLAWRPNGKSFAVGSFNMLQLCDRNGWGYSRNNHSYGSLLCMEWDPNGSHLMCACGNGNLFVANLEGTSKEWCSVSATLVDPTTITITIPSETESNVEDIDFSSAVVDFAVSCNKLVACTLTECHIVSLSNLQNSIVLDLKNPVSNIIMSSKNFALVSASSGILVYDYDGKFVCSPRFPGIQFDLISEGNTSLSSDTIAFIDHADKKRIRLFDSSTGKPSNDSFTNEIVHEMEISQIALSQCGNAQQERRIVFLDNKAELFVSPVVPLSGGSSNNSSGRTDGKSHRALPVRKLGSQVSSVSWNDACDVVIAVDRSSSSSSALVIWYYPNAPFVDKDLLNLACETKESSHLVKNPRITSFWERKVNLRCEDGALLEIATSPYPTMIYEYATTYRWKEALRVCRLAKSENLWAMLAGFSVQYLDLDTAVIALCEIREVDKLQYLRFIKSIKNKERRNAEMFLYRRCPEEAVATLLQARPPLVYHAIKVYIRLFQWEKALTLALQKDSGFFVDVVLWYRKKYLTNFGKEEAKDGRFAQLFEKFGDLDEKVIEKKKLKGRRDESGQ